MEISRLDLHLAFVAGCPVEQTSESANADLAKANEAVHCFLVVLGQIRIVEADPNDAGPLNGRRKSASSRPIPPAIRFKVSNHSSVSLRFIPKVIDEMSTVAVQNWVPKSFDMFAHQPDINATLV